MTVWGRKTSLLPVLVIILVVIGLALIGFFGWRAFHAHRRFQERGPAPSVTDVEAIRGWMTLPYITQAYGVPQQALFDGLGIPKAGNETRSITELAEEYGRDAAEVRQAVQQAIQHYHAPPLPPPPAGMPP
jgi:hypothetical protein